MKRWITGRNGGLWILSLVITAALNGEQLPIKTYTTADGLPSNTTYKIVPDSHGFLWFCTAEGLARFDGYDFKTYGRKQGLPSNDVRDLIETHGGGYWVATVRGLARFYPNAEEGRKFRADSVGKTPSADDIRAVYEGRTGTIWAGTAAGLYRLTKISASFERVELEGNPSVSAILEDRHGDLWVGTQHGLYRLGSDGKVQRYGSSLLARLAFRRPSTPGLEDFTWIISLFEDRQGILWVGARGAGLYSLTRDSSLPAKFTLKAHPIVNKVQAVRVRAVVQARDGTLWMATTLGLVGVRLEGAAHRFRIYTISNGLTETSLYAAVQDYRGDLWVGSQSSGVMRIRRNGYTAYDQKDGFGYEFPISIFGSQTGETLFVARNLAQSHWAVSIFDGERFQSARPNFDKPLNLGWRSGGQVGLQGRRGDWWFATGQGVLHFPSVAVGELARTRPKRIYTTRDGLVNDEATALFEDFRGDVWMVTNSPGKDSLSRWVRATDTLHTYSPRDLPAPFDGEPVFAEDRAKNLWFSYGGVLSCFRQGRFSRIASDGPVIGDIQAIYLDRFGRLWLGDAEFGLIRMDDPSVDHPKLTRYSVAQGLSSDAVSCLTGDKWGRIYACTGQGIDRIDPATGRIKHYGRSDGLPRGDLRNAYSGRDGTLWFATQYQISRFVPEPDLPESPADVKVSALRIRGIRYPISDLGETAIAGLALPSDRNQVQIDFTGLGFRSDELRYQYMLEGADRNWGPPSDQRTVNYASLSPGEYRFLVRAATADGVARSMPASVGFRIFPPLWQRWWFVLLVLCAVGLTIHFLYRVRMQRLLDLERIRTRIATDLHDDIGASLSQIALLTELVDQRANPDGKVTGPLRQIGGISRELVDSMSDIVWSVDPRKDSLANLAQRMRIFAGDIFSTRNIELSFQAPPSEHYLKLEVQERRQVLLIFKEAVNNIVRHSNCTAAAIELTVSREWLTLSLQDNGAGFDPRRIATGHGLVSMRSRAENLGGTFHISSDRGTKVVVRIPSGSVSNPWRGLLRKRAVRKGSQ